MGNWVSIYKSDNMNQVEVVKAFLFDNEIDAVIVNKKNSVNIHISHGEVELHVNSTAVLRAKHLIEKNKL